MIVKGQLLSFDELKDGGSHELLGDRSDAVLDVGLALDPPLAICESERPAENGSAVLRDQHGGVLDIEALCVVAIHQGLYPHRHNRGRHLCADGPGDGQDRA